MTLILLANFHSFCNAGDVALLEVSVRQLREAIPGVTIKVIANYPLENGFSRLGLKAIPSPEAILRQRGAWKDLRRVYSQADALISLPGNPFFSMGRLGWTLAASAAQLWLAKQYGLPYFTLAQTIGPFRRGWEMRMMRRLLHSARQVWVRDETSLNLLQSWGLSQVQYAPDAVFSFPPGEHWVRRHSTSFQIGVSVITAMVRNLPDLIGYYRTIGDAFTELIREKKIHVTFFGQSCGPSQREDDRLAAHTVVEGMPADVQDSVTIDETEYPPSQLTQRYAEMDGFLAWRLHAGLLATLGGVPTVWLSYLSKTEGVLRSLGWQDRLLPLDKMNGFTLKITLNNILDKKDTNWVNHIVQLEGLALQSRQPVQAIAAELAKEGL
ncbi:MAG TPA: polysaccharide pyruvyl transferase family protein [Longilinea sp.]|nr:polysaccharide pyruvyl transferase family protein [Longilinea sp.]